MKSFIKNNIKFIIVIVICLIGSSITTLATNYIFSSNEVSYDNTESGLHANEVQGAIDEVFQHATDYSEIKTKIGTGSLNTTAQNLIGGVNELNGKLTTKQDKLTLSTFTVTRTSYLSSSGGFVSGYKYGNLCIVNINSNYAKSGSGWQTIATLQYGAVNEFKSVFQGDKAARISGTNLQIYSPPSSGSCEGQIVYFTN